METIDIACNCVCVWCGSIMWNVCAIDECIVCSIVGDMYCIGNYYSIKWCGMMKWCDSKQYYYCYSGVVICDLLLLFRVLFIIDGSIWLGDVMTIDIPLWYSVRILVGDCGVLTGIVVNCYVGNVLCYYYLWCAVVMIYWYWILVVLINVVH